MRCPVCGTTNTSTLHSENKKGYGFCLGILGYICFGLPGILCGLLGMNKTVSHSLTIVCGDCGYKTKI